MFCCMLLYVHSSIAIILMAKRELVALLNLSSWCLVMVEWLFLAVPWGCLWLWYFLIILTIFYTSHIDHFTPKHTAFEQPAACLSVFLELLPGLILFAILWHAGWSLEKTICMNMNYNYLTTIFRSILTQIYVFLVLFTIFHFDLEKLISKNCKYTFFHQKFLHLGMKLFFFLKLINCFLHLFVLMWAKKLYLIYFSIKIYLLLALIGSISSACTVNVLKFQKKPRQTEQTQIRLLLKKQSD